MTCTPANTADLTVLSRKKFKLNDGSQAANFCYKNFWSFTKNLFDDSTERAQSSFNEDEICQYFNIT